MNKITFNYFIIMLQLQLFLFAFKLENKITPFLSPFYFLKIINISGS